jgi:hypothetical protein
MQHMTGSPHSLVERLCGLHKGSFPRRAPVRVLVAESIVPAHAQRKSCTVLRFPFDPAAGPDQALLESKVPIGA